MEKPIIVRGRLLDHVQPAVDDPGRVADSTKRCWACWASPSAVKDPASSGPTSCSSPASIRRRRRASRPAVPISRFRQDTRSRRLIARDRDRGGRDRQRPPRRAPLSPRLLRRLRPGSSGQQHRIRPPRPRHPLRRRHPNHVLISGPLAPRSGERVRERGPPTGTSLRPRRAPRSAARQHVLHELRPPRTRSPSMNGDNRAVPSGLASLIGAI